MNVHGLEHGINQCLVKNADSILGRPDTLAGTATQTGLYMIPVVGSALSVADGVNDLFHGRWKSGLGNLALGVGTGLADIFSGGSAGTLLRGAATAGRAARGAATAARMAKGLSAGSKFTRGMSAIGHAGRTAWNGAKGANMLSRTYRGAKGFVNSAGKVALGQGVELAQRGARSMLGANGYSRLVNAGRTAAGYSNSARAAMQGWRGWRPVAAAERAFRAMPGSQHVIGAGRWAAGKYRAMPGYVKLPATMAAYSYVPGMDLVAQATPFRSVRGRMMQRALFSEGGLMVPWSEKAKSFNPNSGSYQYGTYNPFTNQYLDQSSGKWLPDSGAANGANNGTNNGNDLTGGF